MVVNIIRRIGIFRDQIEDQVLVAQETGAQTAVLDPLEGLDEEGRKQGLDYLKLMEQNIANLQKALNE